MGPAVDSCQHIGIIGSASNWSYGVKANPLVFCLRISYFFLSYRLLTGIMDSPNQQVRDCTSVAYDYLQNKSDKNLVALQKQLQSLSLVTDLEIFEPSSSETLELYLCLEKFLTPATARSTVAGKVLALLAHISECSTIRAALRWDTLRFYQSGSTAVLS